MSAKTINITSQDSNIYLTFCDDGGGMNTVNLENIFEQFFTTKRGSGGSGLCMHIVYNLVRQSLYGSITCVSKPDEGTKFELIVPRHLSDRAPKSSINI